MTDTIRVYELAKELGVTSKEILEKMEGVGLGGKTYQASLDWSLAERIRNFYRPVKIVEKRITPGIIRRRTQVERPVVTPPQEEKPPVVMGVAKPLPKAAPEETRELVKEEEVPAAPFEAKEIIEEVAAPVQEEALPLGEAPPSEKKPLPDLHVPEEVKEPISQEEVIFKRKLEDKGTAWRPEPRARERLPRGEIFGRRNRLFRVPAMPRLRKMPPAKAAEKRVEVAIPGPGKRLIKIVDTVTVGDLAKRMGAKVGEVIKKLISLGVMAHINYALDYDSASLVASDFGFQVENVAFEPEMVLGEEPQVPEEDLVPRPPVVTVMGHVDHGKTSLLDAVRRTNVAGLETGGITQHIGAYQVKLDRGQITFLDTPGHEAFTAMRARGAKVTDLVVLVVAADDGVMPQTVEAIDHARAAGVPIIVATNKIDKPNADPARVKQSLSELDLVPEEWGGNTVFVEVSARKRLGIKDLLEFVLLQAEILELKANPNRLAKGTIIEAKLDKGRGAVATVLVQQGTLRVGDPFVCGNYYGRVRAMFNEWGQKVAESTPSQPVEVLGLSGVPEAGEVFRAVADERKAREVSFFLRQKQREKGLSLAHRLTLEELYSRAQKGEVKELNLIIKADVQGSVEALKDALAKQGTEMVKLRFIHCAASAITESDIMLAMASNAIIIGFNAKPGVKVQTLAEQQGVDVRLYDVIYDVVADVRKAMEGLLEPTLQEVVLGRAEVRQIFQVAKVGTIAGCQVSEGRLLRGTLARVIRQGAVVYQGNLASLKRFKDDVREVTAGYECGLTVDNFSDWAEGDLVESYQFENVPTRLE